MKLSNSGERDRIQGHRDPLVHDVAQVIFRFKGEGECQNVDKVKRQLSI